MRLNAWDLAAGSLIVQEAGGVVTDIHGKPDYFRKPYAVVAATPPFTRR